LLAEIEYRAKSAEAKFGTRFSEAFGRIYEHAFHNRLIVAAFRGGMLTISTA